MVNDAEFEAHLAKLREKFRARLGSYRQRLGEARDALAVSSDDGAALRQMKAAAHELAGAAATFGFDVIGDVARELEYSVDERLAGRSDLTDVVRLLRQLLGEIDRAA